MNDITHNNVFTSNVAERMRRTIDAGPPLPERAVDHEVAPYVPPPPPTDGQVIAEGLISQGDKATNIVLDALDQWEARIAEIREVVLKSKIGMNDAIRTHMMIGETAMRGVEQIGQQIVAASKALGAMTNGK